MKIQKAAKSYASIQVIDRLVSLLDAIARYREPASLKLLSAETGLHTSTAFRILASLESHGLVERDRVGRYRLGSKLLHLGGRTHRELDLREEARPVLEWLRGELDETVNLTVPEGDEAVYVERATTRKVMRVEHVIGSRAPLHVTAVGKLFLAERGARGCAEYAARSGLRALTPNTITDAARLESEVAAAARQGYALDTEEAEQGVGCIAVPVRDASGSVVAALSVSAPLERRRLEWVSVLQQGAARLSERLGYDSTAPERQRAN
ncbi:IclR family transcriptional regulator [Sulfurifustis variabilis]|uniref:HTH-type transcriptional repressor AllR n=1 Tax=Sulfurifustis variabilis TaxID=1675686 RepID=A0A1B4V1A9_9GAMM|nr:IclR family transcriptional regulator [Sulfurifustis variabilis]BAU47055.1 IclR family transcriptional regulator [Sulfurifustis variabilis]